MLEAWHRARDIMYTDKTDSNVRTSKIISKYLSLLKDDMTSCTIQSPNKFNNEKLATIEEEYNKLAHQRGAVIQDIVRIDRTEESRFLFEDADFSFETIKKSIAQGYNDAERALLWIKIVNVSLIVTRYCHSYQLSNHFLFSDIMRYKIAFGFDFDFL